MILVPTNNYKVYSANTGIREGSSVGW